MFLKLQIDKISEEYLFHHNTFYKIGNRNTFLRKGFSETFEKTDLRKSCEYAPE